MINGLHEYREYLHNTAKNVKFITRRARILERIKWPTLSIWDRLH
jgi:hypothetical protein